MCDCDGVDAPAAAVVKEGKVEGKQESGKTAPPEGKQESGKTAPPEGKTSTPRFRTASPAASPPPYPTMHVTKAGSSSAVAPSRTPASQDFVLKVGGLEKGCLREKAQFTLGVASRATLLLTNKKGQDRDIPGASVDKLIAALKESELNWFTWCQRKDNGNMYFTATTTGKGKNLTPLGKLKEAAEKVVALNTGKTKDVKSDHAMAMCGESNVRVVLRCSVRSGFGC